MTETAYLAGGCFWGMQDLIRRLPGVVSTQVGYTGGALENATYQHVRSGSTGHTEAIEVVFDPAAVSYRDILELFFQIHDPSTADQQGNDRGTQYRSAIFWADDAQQQTALDTIADVEASDLWPGRVVTQVVQAGAFWPAEPEHQDYLARNPGGYTCHFVRPDWKLPKRAAA
jgi:peptide-methionine (S)-S-oxide reductase